MKKWLLIFVITLCNSLVIAQSYELFKDDTVNRVDLQGKKEGKWILLSTDSTGRKIKISEGVYVNGKKEGKWIDYFNNDLKKSNVDYKGGRPSGEATLFYENGNIKETGVWGNNNWIGSYKLYYSTGSIKQEFFLKDGKKEGKQCYYYPNGKLVLEGNSENGMAEGKLYKYSIDGKLCEECTYQSGNEIINKRKGGNCPDFDQFFNLQNKSKNKFSFDIIHVPNEPHLDLNDAPVRPKSQ